VYERLALIDEAFSPAAPIHNADLLAGRQEQLFKLQETSRTIGQHAAIYGERGVGKTSLFSVFAADLRGRGVHAPSITCAPTNSFDHLWDEMLQEWAALLGVNAKHELKTARLGLNQQTVVRAIASLLGEGSVVFIFDEFDNLPDDVTAEFANLMKALSDRRIRAHLVVVGIAEDVDMLVTGHRSVARGLREIKLPRLSPDELGAILERGFEIAGIQLPPNLANRIIDLSYGLPHYAHAYGKHLAVQAARHEVDVVDEKFWVEAVRSVISDAEQQVAGVYFDAINAADDPILGDVLLACAMTEPDTFGFFDSTGVLVQLSKLVGTPPDETSLEGILDVLCAEDVRQALERKDLASGRARFRFVNPLMQPYVRAISLTNDRNPTPQFPNVNLGDDPFRE